MAGALTRRKLQQTLYAQHLLKCHTKNVHKNGDSQLEAECIASNAHVKIKQLLCNPILLMSVPDRPLDVTTFGVVHI